jgi:hypothetical protein
VTPRLGSLVVLLIGILSLPLVAQVPVSPSGIQGIVNAVVERRAAGQDVAREIEAVGMRGTPAWIGYRVPITKDRAGAMRNAATCCGRCRLEPPADLLVLVRVEQSAIVQLRAVAVDCDIDAGGMPLAWLEGVTPAASVAWLRSTIEASPAVSRQIWTAALAALAYHAAPEAVTALTGIAITHPDREVRRQAMVRIGQSTDPRAAEFLARILQ